MAKTKTAKKSASKSAQKSARKRQTAEHVERNGAHAYAERVDPVTDALDDLGGSATVQELFKALKTGTAGMFATSRRVAATVRSEAGKAAGLSNSPSGTVTLAKHNRTTAKSKRNVSRKRTRSAK